MEGNELTLTSFFKDKVAVVCSDYKTAGSPDNTQRYILIFPDGYVRTEFKSLEAGKWKRRWQSGQIGEFWDFSPATTLNNRYKAPNGFQGLARFDPIYFSTPGRDNFRLVVIDEALKIPWIHEWLERDVRAFKNLIENRQAEKRNEKIRIRNEQIENERKAKRFEEYLRRREEEYELEPYQNAYYIIVIILIVIAGVWIGC